MILRWDGGEQKSLVTGELFLKGSDKVLMTVQTDVPGEGKKTVTEVSDGERHSGPSLSKSGSKEPGKVMGNYLRAALSHPGILAGGFLVHEALRNPDFDVKDQFSVFNVREGAEEKESKTLTYSLTTGGDQAEVQIWYDPKDFRLLKRVLKLKAGGPGSTFTETYEGFTLNADIPDEKFKLQ